MKYLSQATCLDFNRELSPKCSGWQCGQEIYLGFMFKTMIRILAQGQGFKVLVWGKVLRFLHGARL